MNSCRKNSLSLISLLLVLCMLLGGCSGTANTETTAATTQAALDIYQKSDPSEDDTLNILMIGSSFCYYYPDELYGLAEAAGIKIRVCNVYYSGCKLEQHWSWWKNREAHYEYFTYDENGRQSVEGCDLEYCLQQQNWDVISLQESSSCVRDISTEEALANDKTYLEDLWGYLKEQFPLSQHCWHQTWAYQIGYDRNGFAMTSVDQQQEYASKMEAFSTAICKEYDLTRINTGEAWQIVRQGGYDNLCARLSANDGKGDYYHDGDIGGGQYLNACVWFEILTGQSCVGNSFRPDYADYLTEDLFTTFQNAAHQAVENMKAE